MFVRLFFLFLTLILPQCKQDNTDLKSTSVTANQNVPMDQDASSQVDNNEDEPTIDLDNIQMSDKDAIGYESIVELMQEDTTPVYIIYDEGDEKQIRDNIEGPDGDSGLVIEDLTMNEKINTATDRLIVVSDENVGLGLVEEESPSPDMLAAIIVPSLIAVGAAVVGGAAFARHKFKMRKNVDVPGVGKAAKKMDILPEKQLARNQEIPQTGKNGPAAKKKGKVQKKKNILNNKMVQLPDSVRTTNVGLNKNYDEFYKNLGIQKSEKVVMVNASNTQLAYRNSGGLNKAFQDTEQLGRRDATDWDGLTDSSGKAIPEPVLDPKTNKLPPRMNEGQFAISNAAVKDVPEGNAKIYHAVGLRKADTKPPEVEFKMEQMTKEMLEKAQKDGADVIVLPSISTAIFAKNRFGKIDKNHVNAAYDGMAKAIKDFKAAGNESPRIVLNMWNNGQIRRLFSES